MKIYPNYADAVWAARAYVKRLGELQEELGIREECDDSCCAVYIYVQYLDENGKTQTLCYI